MIYRVAIFFSMSAFLYTITFGIFMTALFRIPAPLLLGILPLLFINNPLPNFGYHKELIVAIIALFFYDIVGNADYLSFLASTLTIVSCVFYFNYFVGTSGSRYRLSIAIFYVLLTISMLTLLADHFNPDLIDPIRAIALDEAIKQSPAGIATTQFTFGYQLAAFTTFAMVGMLVYKRHFLLTIGSLFFCLACLFLGMNRSAFLVFVISTAIFLISYYRFRGILIIGTCIVVVIGIYTSYLKDISTGKNNTLAKSQAKEANEFNRATMSMENLSIISDYPYGLIFYGKNWEDVTYRNPLFTGGLSSHNAYLMFITYLGPFFGFGLLLVIYAPIFRIFFRQLRIQDDRKHGLLTALLFSFLAVSLNSFSHNGWLLSCDGPTLFLYFAILHYRKMHQLPPLQLIKDPTLATDTTVLKLTPNT